MPVWLSPLPLPEAIEQRLQQLGWHPWSGDPKALPADAAWLYDTPDRLLADGFLAPEQLAEGYASLLAEPSGARFIALWRLLGESETAVPPDPEPLPAALTQLLLQQYPALLDAYLDLELRADLQGGEPDLAYRRRLQEAVNPIDALAAWHALIAASQRQEEIDALQTELNNAQGAAQEAREEAELTLLQLHQVQEELEHYFLLSRGLQRQLERYGSLQERSYRLLARALPQAAGMA